MPTLAFRRRDPWWGQEGPAARRRHQRERILSSVAFLASLMAIAGAAVVWSIQLGFASMLGINVHLVLG
jgi:hypothetical protein